LIRSYKCYPHVSKMPVLIELVEQRWYKERWALLVTSFSWRTCCVKYKKVRRYQRGNKTSVIRWPKGKGKQYLQNTTHKTKDRAPKIPLKTGIELVDSGWVNSSCSTCDTHCYKPSDEETTSVITTNGTYPWSFVKRKIM
jgi:hypothetical protein